MVSDLKSAVYSAISQLKADCEAKLSAYSDMASEAKSLIEKARSKQESAQSELSSSSAQLASTPKTIKVTQTDSNGNKVTKEKPNPAYAMAKAEMKNAKAQVAASNNVAADAIKVGEQIRARYNELQSINRSIDQLGSEYIPQLDKVISMIHNTDDSLQKAITAINEYLDYKIKY